MYINTVVKYQLYQGYMFRPKTATIRPMQNIYKVQYKCALYGITFRLQ